MLDVKVWVNIWCAGDCASPFVISDLFISILESDRKLCVQAGARNQTMVNSPWT